jgi:D-alanine-D-alanine ligase
LIHGIGGEDGCIQGLLQELGIPYVGCDTFASAVSFDKSFCKAVADSAGIPTVPCVTLVKEDSVPSGAGSWHFSYDDARIAAESAFGYPMFVKPCREGSSFGAGIANSPKELVSAAQTAFTFGDRIIIEKFISGVTELECAYFSFGDRAVVTPPGTVRHGSAFYDNESKYGSDDTRLIPRADVSEDVVLRVKSYTDKLGAILGIRHLSRMDYFLDTEGNVFFNEVNTVPGFTRNSLYPAMLEACGIDKEQFVSQLLQTLRGVGL